MLITSAVCLESLTVRSLLCGPFIAVTASGFLQAIALRSLLPAKSYEELIDHHEVRISRLSKEFIIISTTMSWCCRFSTYKSCDIEINLRRTKL